MENPTNMDEFGYPSFGKPPYSCYMVYILPKHAEDCLMSDVNKSSSPNALGKIPAGEKRQQ